MIPDRWDGMAAAYALGALDTDERTAFEDRIESDRELRARVDEYRQSVAMMTKVVGEVSLPANLRAQILAATTFVEPSSHSDASVRTAPFTAQTGDSSAGGAASTSVRSRSVMWQLAVAATAVLAIGAGIWVVQLRRSVGSLEVANSTMADQLVALRRELAAAEVELVRYDSIASALSGPDLRFATLTAPGTTPRMHLVLNPIQDVVLVAAVNLPPAPDGRVYQLWGIREGEAPISLGTFDSSSDNSALQALAVPAGQVYDVGAVTEEPVGGSPLPTTDPFLVGPWSAQES